MFDEHGNFIGNVTTSGKGVIPSLGGITPSGRNAYLDAKYPELVELGKRGRAYTITFTDKMLDVYKDKHLWINVMDVVRKTKGVDRYELIPEYSNVGRFHLHGVIVCAALPNYETLRKKLSKQFGNTKVKYIDNTVKWADYCTKQKAEMIWGKTVVNAKTDKVDDNVK